MFLQYFTGNWVGNADIIDKRIKIKLRQIIFVYAFV